jgi:hypothetical protein
MAERGHSLDSIKKSIEARKPDFDAYIDPQKKHADMIIQVRRDAALLLPCRVYSMSSGVMIVLCQGCVCRCVLQALGFPMLLFCSCCHCC